MIDTTRLLTIIIEGGSLIAGVASLTAAVIISGFTKKIDTGILAGSLKSISLGLSFIALGILADAVQDYLQSANFPAVNQFITVTLLLKLAFFVIGAYIIVIGSKKTGDQLDSLKK